MPFIKHDGIRFYYEESGEGSPLVFCHGLTGSLEQPKELLGEFPGVRRVVWDARGHGQTEVGPPETFNFQTFAKDLGALLDELGISEAVVGGISMGAAVSARFAIDHPGRARALVLVRPAWLDQGLPEGLRLYPIAAEYLGAHGAQEGRELFVALPEFRALAEKEPDAAASLLGQFTLEGAVERRHRLHGIPRDAPIHDWREADLLQIPTLVIGNEPDYVHPWSYAAAWAEHLPCARLVKTPSRHREFPAHAESVRRNLAAFLDDIYPNQNTKEMV
jgi:pimeloyl-ACP methyl ester carboxylesterase